MRFSATRPALADISVPNHGSKRKAPGYTSTTNKRRRAMDHDDAKDGLPPAHGIKEFDKIITYSVHAIRKLDTFNHRI